MQKRSSANTPASSGGRAHAIALQYCQQDELPRIVASGAGEIAKQILELAKRHNIPVREDEELTAMLANLNVGAFISPESYQLVAEVISFLYHSDKEWRERHPELKDVMERSAIAGSQAKEPVAGK